MTHRNSIRHAIHYANVGLKTYDFFSYDSGSWVSKEHGGKLSSRKKSASTEVLWIEGPDRGSSTLVSTSFLRSHLSQLHPGLRILQGSWCDKANFTAQVEKPTDSDGIQLNLLVMKAGMTSLLEDQK